MQNMMRESRYFNMVEECQDAELIIGKITDEFYDCEDIPVFSTSYKEFKNNSNSIGAFYWRKGRPQVRFKIDVINRYNLNLEQNLRKYAQ
jgi:hypothetical protein